MATTILQLNDEEYVAYLNALASKYLRLHRLHCFGGKGGSHVEFVVDNLASLARVVSAIAEHDDNHRLVEGLGKELEYTQLGHEIQLLDESGVMNALQDDPTTLFCNLRRSVVPDADVTLLRRCGVQDPEAEIALLIHYSRTHLASPNALHPERLAEVHSAFKKAKDRLVPPPSPVEDYKARAARVKRKKTLTGIGRILTGLATGVGNLLLGTGSIVAPNPATGYLVIGSCGVAVGSILQGIGDLRGE